MASMQHSQQLDYMPNKPELRIVPPIGNRSPLKSL